MEPLEFHNLETKLSKLKPYKLPSALLDFLQSDNLRFDLGDECPVKFIDFFPLVDTVEMKVGRQKLLRISKETDNYSALLIVWNPKKKKVGYYDLEHEEFGAFAPFEDFMQNAAVYMEKAINGEFAL